MKHKKLSILGILSAVVIFTIAATAMAAPDAAAEPEAEALAEAEVSYNETICEVDTETGEIRLDGDIVCTVDPEKLEELGGSFTVSQVGADGAITISPADAMPGSYEIIESGQNADGNYGTIQWSDAD